MNARVPRAVGFVRQDVIVHSLGDRAGRSVLGALDNLVRGGEFGFGFGDSLRKSIRFLSDVSEVALVLPRVVRRVREEDEEGVESGGAHGGRPRGVGLEHGHLPLDAQSLNLGEGRPVRDGDWRIANVLVDPLAVTDDDLGALQELALLGLGVEGCLVDEPVVHAVDLLGSGSRVVVASGKPNESGNSLSKASKTSFLDPSGPEMTRGLGGGTTSLGWILAIAVLRSPYASSGASSRETTTSVKSPSASHPVICREILSRRSAISSFCSSVSSGGSSGSLTSSSSPPSASPSAAAASSPSSGGGGVSLILRILASSPSTLEGVTRQNAPAGTPRAVASRPGRPRR